MRLCKFWIIEDVLYEEASKLKDFYPTDQQMLLKRCIWRELHSILYICVLVSVSAAELNGADKFLVDDLFC